VLKNSAEQTVSQSKSLWNKHLMTDTAST